MEESIFRATRILITVLLAFGASIAATRSTVSVGGRSVITYAPSGASNPALIVSMHGMGIPASMNQGMMMFEKLADTGKFVVTYPEAAPGANLQWDLGSMKDVNFILAIIDTMARKFNIDRNRVYVTGFSMGGMMSWYLTCKIPDKIAAAVPGNGYPMGGMSGCSEKRHVPILQIHGTADDFVKYSTFVGSFGPSQVSRYGCPAPVRIKPYPVNKPTSQSFMDSWTNCDKNGLKSEISLLHVTGMIHDWATPGKMNANDDPKFKGKPFDIDGTYEAWNWMKKFSLTGTTAVSDRTGSLAGLPVLTARMSEGRIQLASDVSLGEVKVLDLQGKTQATWTATSPSDNLVTFPAGQLKSGVYMIEARGMAGRTVQSVMVP